ncbi:RNAse (barnase) inhibitor barstar [Novosphingobium sp. PhB165]|uniref:barstar family protein n=1 Tax=Novosphingobium sp. PhB165 TaxID=2485105 RepID=UPI0010458F2C|nr:barstar family protein [Novosphingobium sp. PhB165]TCM12037.1 RNAse (barnase) inhibitor barstar [Novosphingobium sp. PhB165]
MIEFELHAAAWKSSDDFYQALLPVLGAPDWHGHNLDALEDSIFAGEINKVDPPFRIVVYGASNLPVSLKATLLKTAQMFKEGRRVSGADAYLELRP